MSQVQQHKIQLDEHEMPTRWYNVLHDLPTPPPPVLHPGTGQPVGPDDLAPLFPMDLILQEVYEVRQFQIAGLERWTSRWSTTRLTIRAKASGATSETELKRMAQGLLSERFRLRLHREMRELPVYALVPAKGGIKLQVTEQDGRPRGIGGINGSVPMGRLSGNNVSMPHFVQILSEQQLDRPVVDKTGFTEAFDFKLEYATIDRADAVGPSIFTALQEQLGLRLEPVRAAVEILVIDHIEKPSEN